jgi:deoxyribose-phosphate aldolase
MDQNELTDNRLAKTLDHALIKPEMTEDEVIAGCALALRHDIAAVSVKPCYLPLVVKQLRGSNIAAGTLVSFPHGHSTPQVKVYEAINGVENGATELDIVMNIGAFRAGKYDTIREEIGAIVQAVGDEALVKVILENHFLTPDEIVKACHLLEQAGVDFVKTATGYADRGATTADVKLMRQSVGPGVRIKAAGGIRTLADVRRMIAAGAARVGTTSTEAIMEEFSSESQQSR